MCLYNDPESVKEVQSLEGDTITCYKVLNKLVSDDETVDLESPYTLTSYTAGVITSDASPTARCSKKRYASIDHGIHVYKTKEFAKNSGWRGVVVEFTASKKDLLGADETEMVFRKVTLSEKEYKKHTRVRVKA